MNGPNPYSFPVTLIYERYVQGIQTTEERSFSDLQQAWCWARDRTGVFTFPEGPQAVGEHAGWEFMSFLFVKSQITAHPEDEFVIFKRENADGEFHEYSVLYDYGDDDDEDDEDD